MQDGADPAAQQDEALERLEEARRDLREARQAIEEELAREKLAKLADQIKGLKERQESRLEESARIHQQLLQRKQWSRGLLSSLRDLARSQDHLAKEAAGLADGKLAGASVAVWVIEASATSCPGAQFSIAMPASAPEVTGAPQLLAAKAGSSHVPRELWPPSACGMPR